MEELACRSPDFVRKFRFKYSKCVRVALLNSESRALKDAGQDVRLSTAGDCTF
jgi:hypothetical protein